VSQCGAPLLPWFCFCWEWGSLGVSRVLQVQKDMQGSTRLNDPPPSWEQRSTSIDPSLILWGALGAVAVVVLLARARLSGFTLQSSLGEWQSLGPVVFLLQPGSAGYTDLNGPHLSGNSAACRQASS
jgi:hypothetical protein